MKKIALLLALAMLVCAFAGCGNKEEPDHADDVPVESILTSEELVEESILHACAEGAHTYVTEVVADPGCQAEGAMLFLCVECGDGHTEAIPALGHEGTSATCLTDSVCLNCNELLEPAMGHTTAQGQCERCGETVG